MRPLNYIDIPTQSASIDALGQQIDASQLFAVSAQLVASSSAAGTFKLQASNDMPAAGDLSTGFTATTWLDIPDADISVSGSGPYLIPKQEISYQWIRAVFTTSGAAVAATLELQDLTYTAVTPGDAGNDITIEYVDDGTAGSETVDVTDTAIVVHMDATPVTGSTAQDIYDAVSASSEASDLVLVEITGTASDVQTDGGPDNLEDGADPTSIGNVTVNIKALGV